MADADPTHTQQRIIRALLDPGRYPHAVDRVEHMETHISHILLAGDYAYKIKKPVDLGFLDFSTLDRRQICCEEEIRLNRRLAPDVYLCTLAIAGSPDAPTLDGPLETAIEFAVQMRRFPQECLMDRRLRGGLVEPVDIDAVADMVAAFHERADRTPPPGLGTPEAMHGASRENFSQLIPRVEDASASETLCNIQSWTEERYRQLRPVLAGRAEKGWVRDGHGDLHSGNIALLESGPLIFDCVEFSPALRWTDVQSEIAFLMMDLISHDRSDLAWRLVNRYLERTGDYAGLQVLQYFLVYRAMVRAKVAGIRAEQSSDADRVSALRDRAHFLDLAHTCKHCREPFLTIMHGLSGSGKSTVAGVLAELAGAVRLRSDVERKRLAGLALEERSNSALDAGLYSTDIGRLTYARLAKLAAGVLDAGYPVVVDATFLIREQRRTFLELARARDLRVHIVTTRAPIATLERWLSERQAEGGDVSEADHHVLNSQRRRAEELDASERSVECVVDTALCGDRAAIESALRTLLQPCPISS